jgi:hypothetical protein
MKHTIYAGGNKRNLPWENDRNSGNTAPTVRYAAHLKNRHKVIELHLDFCNEVWANWVRSISPTTMMLPALDEIATHLLAAGSKVVGVAVQVKVAAVGTGAIALVGTSALAPAAAATPDSSVDADTDATAGTTGTAGTVTPVSSFAFDMATEGWYYFNVDKFLQDEGEITVKFDQDMGAGCVSFFVEVVDFASEHKCECCLPPCNTPIPEPICQTI